MTLRQSQQLAGLLVVAIGIAFLLEVPARAAETKVVVRAKAKDAMFIGTSIGGARVIIRESHSGAILAQGLTHGGTGNRQKVMGEIHKRGAPMSDADTAKFETVLDLQEPVLATVEVFAPSSQGHSAIRSSIQVWLIPGRHLVGDGLIVEIPGFAVTVLGPQRAEKISLSTGKAVVPITANVVMMCGCPVERGGLWDADRYRVEALILQDGVSSGSIPLTYAGKTNTFEARLEVTAPGDYELQVYAYDSVSGNTGLDATVFRVIK
jgi:hypothetical protein